METTTMNKHVYIKPSMQTVKMDMALRLMGTSGGNGTGDIEELAPERRGGGIFASDEDDTAPGVGRKLW